VDLYGYGQSPPWSSDRDLSLTDEVRLIEPILADAADRFHLVGHSYGAAVALLAALARPGRILSLSLFEPVLFSLLFADDPEQPGAREIASVRDDTTAAVNRGDLSAAASRFVDYWMGEGAWGSTPEKRRPTIEAGMHKVKAEWGALFDEPTPLAELSNLSMNTLLLSGSVSPASTRRIARLVASALPRVEVTEIEGVGHMAPVTHAPVVNALIEDHVERMSDAGAS
jgi:pimeloyl-ACP methyl ester carboxylesterase